MRFEDESDDILRRFTRPHRGQLEFWRLVQGRRCWVPGGAGRWGRAAEPLIYAATTAPLAVLEAIAHLERGEGRRVHTLAHFVARLPALRLDISEASPRWRQRKALTRAIGRRWCESGRSAVLIVPSALCEPGDNLLINADHPAWPGTSRRSHEMPFRFDPRIVRGMR